MERRYGNLDMQRISGFAQEFAKSKLDAIVTVCTVTTRAAVVQRAELNRDAQRRIRLAMAWQQASHDQVRM